MARLQMDNQTAVPADVRRSSAKAMNYTTASLFVATTIVGLLLALWQVQPVLAIFVAFVTPVILVAAYRRSLRKQLNPVAFRSLLFAGVLLAYFGSLGPFQLLFVCGKRNSHWWTQAVTKTSSVIYAPLSSDTVLRALGVDERVALYKHEWDTIRVQSMKHAANWIAYNT